MAVLEVAVIPNQEALSVSSSSRVVDRVGVTFDDPTLVADAGLVLPVTLMVRLGLEELVNGLVRLGGRVGGSRPGRKVLTLVTAIVAGATHIDHADRLRAGATQKVLPFRVMAPSTLGTFLRSFTFGHIRQLDAVIAEVIRRAWSFGAGPGSDQVVVDLDSTICEVHGKQKQGAAYGYTKVLGYHPLLAVWAATGEILHGRLRKGSSQRGAKRFVCELVARVRRAGAEGRLVLRADSGFFSWALIDTLCRLGVAWSITVVGNSQVKAAIDAIDEDAWVPIDYPDGGEAQVAETIYVTGGAKTKRKERRVRLVVRRSRLADPAQLALWPNWRHHAFITDLELPVVEMDRFHREHATVELAIRDLKEGAGLEHCPSGKFFANAAWLACAVLAHNVVRWSALLGDVHPRQQLTVMGTLRSRYFALPGRLVNRSGRLMLRMPSRWPWATTFSGAIDKLRALPMLA
ncbi:MAG TPA: IS1380 family transposase [Acidimicrobiales bacterium]|nr:IS1380 family transposase [Acidimicrobiales bacterium]